MIFEGGRAPETFKPRNNSFICWWIFRIFRNYILGDMEAVMSRPRSGVAVQKFRCIWDTRSICVSILRSQPQGPC